MRKLLIVAAAMLVLAGCDSRTETSKTVVSDGQVSATTKVTANGPAVTVTGELAPSGVASTSGTTP